MITSPTIVPFADVSETNLVQGTQWRWKTVSLTNWYVCGLMYDMATETDAMYCWGGSFPASSQSSDPLCVPQGGIDVCSPPTGGSTLVDYTFAAIQVGPVLGDPVQLAAGASAVGFSLSYNYACAVVLPSPGSPLGLQCWGTNALGYSALPAVQPVASFGGVAADANAAWPGISTAVDANSETYIDGQASALESNAGVSGGFANGTGTPPLSFLSGSPGPIGVLCGLSQIDGSMWCWGGNSSGLFGNGQESSASAGLVSTPAPSNNGTWKFVSTGYYHSCGIRMDDSLWCWGSDDMGQLGDLNGWTYGPTTPVGSG